MSRRYFYSEKKDRITSKRKGKRDVELVPKVDSTEYRVISLLRTMRNQLLYLNSVQSYYAASSAYAELVDKLFAENDWLKGKDYFEYGTDKPDRQRT